MAKGLEMTLKGAGEALERMGIEAFGTEGDEFDPNMHFDPNMPFDPPESVDTEITEEENDELPMDEPTIPPVEELIEDGDFGIQ